MFFRRVQPAVSDSPRGLEQLGAALAAALLQFGRDVGRQPSRRKARQSRSATQPARLSSPSRRTRWLQAQLHPSRLPREYRRGVAPTVLARERARNGSAPYVLETERRAKGVTAAIRRQLHRLRAALARLRDRFRWRRSPAVNRGRYRTRTLVRSDSSSGDRIITTLVLATTIGLGFDLVSARKAVAIETPAIAAAEASFEQALEARIDDLATAIATAEGYFAGGSHDGHTLPYLLNNPGALKKPALDAADLPTWEETGLIQFPTTDAGWAALRHQIRLMLTGTSGIYERSDSLTSVGHKYADGDTNWGANVAATLGVPPARTLAELAPRE